MRAPLAIVTLLGVLAIWLAVGAGDGPDGQVELSSHGGPLVGLVDTGRTHGLVLLEPRRLRRMSEPIELRGWTPNAVVSPGGRLVAAGSGRRLVLVDVASWRRSGQIRLSRRSASVSQLAWPRADRLIAAVGTPFQRQRLLFVDPRRRRVMSRGPRLGWIVQSEPTRRGMVALEAPAHGTGVAPGRLVIAEASGRVRRVRLTRIPAGVGGPRARNVTQVRQPALAVDRRADRAYVIGSERLLAEVDLADGRVSYRRLAESRSPIDRVHDLLEPEAHAGGGPMEGESRVARWLEGGFLAVSGYRDVPRARRIRDFQVPLGLSLVDLRERTFSAATGESSDVEAVGPVALAAASMGFAPEDGPGLAGAGPGVRGFERFPRKRVSILGAAGRLAYVRVHDGRGRVHVVDLENGGSLAVSRDRALRAVFSERLN